MKNVFVLLLFTFVFIFSGVPVKSQIYNSNEKDLMLAEQIKRSTNRSSEGLVEKHSPNGTVSVDLQGRFKHLLLSRLNVSGEPIVGCIASLKEANAFLGKNLETGEIYPNTYDFLFNKQKSQAQRHGMSEGEFLFYKRLIEKAAERRNAYPEAANIVIVNSDAAGEGFNDPTPATPEGGNPGTTLGEQRLNLFDFAADIWGSFLDSTVTIQVDSKFDELECSATRGVLGGAGTKTIHRGHPNFDLANTWYHQALANKQAGVDISGSEDMSATFNSRVNNDPNCLGGERFYLGFDNSTPFGTTNLLIVLLHEMAHGLGFSPFVDGETGELFLGFPDVFTSNMYDRTVDKFWNDMTDGERMTSATNANDVLWDGDNVKIASDDLTAAREASTGRVELYTPGSFDPGSSISHWNTTAVPNLLMEPFINQNIPIDLDLTPNQMRDVGWFSDTNADVVPDEIINVNPTGGVIFVGQQATATWTNTGGFIENVTVEISSDGGLTWQPIGTNVANTGSFNFTVPNTPTTQGSIRVREFNFAEPSGMSDSTFTISNNAPTRPFFDFDGDLKTDIGIFRPAPGEWWYMRSSDLQTNAFQFGASTDIIAPEDFTGDGKTDIAFFRPSSGEWFVLRSEDNSFFAFPFGTNGDIPVPGDYDGDGTADPAVFRPSSATWFIQNSGGGITTQQFGLTGDNPIPKDYDGDGKDDLAIFRPSVAEWFYQRSSDKNVLGFQFGAAGDTPIPADYTGDDKADIGFFRPSSSEWFILRSEDNSFFAFPFGTNGDIPVPGDYDGDGMADPAVFRPSNSTWFLQQSTSGFQAIQFGVINDVPIPSAYIP